MKRLATGLALTTLVVSTGIYEAQARPQYAQKEGVKCAHCHVNPNGGGSRNFRGGFYGANNLSFAQFDETREASIARVDPNSVGEDSVSKIGYITNVTGPALGQIQARSQRTPLLVVFLNSPSDDAGKAAVKTLGKIADTLGKDVTVVGVLKGDTAAALKLTADLGNLMRVLPDPDGEAIKNFKVQQGWDMAFVPKMDPGSTDNPAPKIWSGYSRANLGEALDQIAAAGVTFDKPDISSAPEKALRGEKLGG